ncbi:MAG: D-amino-acid transaminase [Proteobacteria bacterium]|nr:D-amino-acid transaminase [Pseudomonadota bacterium]
MKPRLVYVNGRFVPYPSASVHVEDRGFQFGDSVYEVWAVMDGGLIDAAAHLRRLERSLGELRMTPPFTPAALDRVLREAVRRNRVREGLVYLQITRGAGPRDPLFPPHDRSATVVVIARGVDRAAADARAEAGISVSSQPDQRWGRCDIKTTGLLANVLSKQAARAVGAAEAWLVDGEGRVTEGASSTAWILDPAGRLRTRALDAAILPGVTRARVMEIARREGLEVVEAAFTPEEALGAREAFNTSASGFVTPVVRVDGRPLGDGRPGPVALRLRALYLDHVRNTRPQIGVCAQEPGS